MPPHRYRDDAEIAALAARFVDRSLPKSEWTHAAHFAVACALLRDPARDALREMPALIRAYNEACGTPNSDHGGYHETITLASLRAARSWLAGHATLPLHEALNALLASPYGRPDWLLAHWTHERLFSIAARRAWLEPDRAPLPFG